MIYDRIKTLCKKNGISVNQLEKELSISRGALCKIDTNKPGGEKLQKLSDYFGVTVEYLMTGKEDSEKKESPFTARDERDIKKSLDKIMSSLETKEGAPLYYDGNELELTDENVAMLRDALNTALHTVKLINKEKYNPHKNGK